MTYLHTYKSTRDLFYVFDFCIEIEVYWNSFKVVVRQICAITPIAMGLSICVCLCLCVCVSSWLFLYVSVTFFRTGRTLPKIKDIKNDVCRFCICHRMNGVITKIVLRDLALHFQLQMFKICEIRPFSCCRKLKIEKNQQYTLKHLELNGINSVFASLTLTYIFDFKYVKYVKFVSFCMCKIVKLWKESARYIQTWAIKRRKYRFSSPWPWPTFSRWNILHLFPENSHSYRKHLKRLKLSDVLATFWFFKMEMIKKLFLQICLHLYRIRRRVVVVECDHNIVVSTQKYFGQKSTHKQRHASGSHTAETGRP